MTKFSVPTYMRVGSTWVAVVLRALTGLKVEAIEPGLHALGVPVSKEFVELFLSQPDGIYKSHTFTMRDAIPLLEQGVKVVNIQRCFEDTLVSRLFYVRDVRRVQGLSIESAFSSFFDQFGDDLDDDVYVNLFIETRLRYVEEQIRKWHMHSHVVSGIGCLTLSYEELDGDTEKLVKMLIDGLKLSPTSAQVEQAIEDGKLSNMKQKFFTGHVRKGKVGEWRSYFDKPSTDKIYYLISKVRQKRTYNQL